MSSSLGKRFRDIDAKNDWISLYNKIRHDSSKLQSKLVCKTAKSNENVKLNRYRDVLPFDHSRVVLPSGSYINASHVSVNKADRDYVLTQGPLPDTSEHFWEMVWHQKSKAVIMLNKIVEKNQVKCHQYYPVRSQNENGLSTTSQSLIFGDYEIKLLSENETRHYCLRNLLLKQKKLKEEREILHYQFCTWPDFGVPESTHDFLEFLNEVRKTNVLNHRIYGPPIIHCSAGIGRSGTFIIVDAALVIAKKSKNPSDIDILKMVTELRQYRMGLIQTYDQLRFCWKAIVDALENEEWKKLVDTHCCGAEPEVPPLLTSGSNRPDLRRSSANNMTDSDQEDEPVANRDPMRVNSIPTSTTTIAPPKPAVDQAPSSGANPDSDSDMMSPKRRKSKPSESDLCCDRSSGGTTGPAAASPAFSYPATKEDAFLQSYETRLRKRQEKASELRDKIERIHLKLHQDNGRSWFFWPPSSYQHWLAIGGGAILGVGFCAFLYNRWF